LLFFFYYIQMFFCTIMNIFITLFENVNKSCTSAGRLSLTTNQCETNMKAMGLHSR
jgi:hypothetical protein